MMMVRTIVMTTWTYNNKDVEELPEDCEAFVYIITKKPFSLRVGKTIIIVTSIYAFLGLSGVENYM